jgi:hypothetical protein
VTERLSRSSPTQIFYAFQVEDPVYYTQPWRAEESLNARKERVYEYACHEGPAASRPRRPDYEGLIPAAASGTTSARLFVVERVTRRSGTACYLGVTGI